MCEYYYPGLWERVTEDPENPVSKVGLSSAIVTLLKDNEDDMIVADYNPMYELAVSSGCCSWGFLQDQLFRNNWAFPLPEGSPFLPVFNNM